MLLEKIPNEQGAVHIGDFMVTYYEKEFENKNRPKKKIISILRSRNDDQIAKVSRLRGQTVVKMHSYCLLGHILHPDSNHKELLKKYRNLTTVIKLFKLYYWSNSAI